MAPCLCADSCAGVMHMPEAFPCPGEESGVAPEASPAHGRTWRCAKRDPPALGIEAQRCAGGRPNPRADLALRQRMFASRESRAHVCRRCVPPA
eukprot:11031281-Alexandrium_andersonii.AAC.1